jgi:hypothetical protein
MMVNRSASGGGLAANPKQSDLVPGKGQFRPRFPQSAQLRLSDNLFLDPATDTDIISSATLLDGRTGNGWARLLQCGRDRSGGGFPNAGYEPHPSCGDCPVTRRALTADPNILGASAYRHLPGAKGVRPDADRSGIQAVRAAAKAVSAKAIARVSGRANIRRTQLTGCASGNLHVPLRISGRGRNRRTV